MPKAKKNLKDKLSRMEAIPRLKKKKLRLIFRQLNDIREEYNKDRYEKLKKELAALCRAQQDLSNEFAKVNNSRMEEKPDHKYLFLFVNAMRALLKGGETYNKGYKLRSPLIFEMSHLKTNYEEFTQKMYTVEGHEAMSKIKELYPKFINVEFGLSRIGYLCEEIRGLARHGIRILNSLISPTSILKKEDRGYREAVEEAKTHTVANMGLVEDLTEETDVERNLARQLKKDFLYYGTKGQLVIEKIKELRG